MIGYDRLSRDFYSRDVLVVAPDLIGKDLVIKDNNGMLNRHEITEVEAYRGEEDAACHASKGRTRRTEVMYGKGGMIYMYLIYGMYWMLNIVSGEEENPQAALIRGVSGINGPGKLTRSLHLDGSYYGEDLTMSDRIWLEDRGRIHTVKNGVRIGINYSGEPWISKLWRFYL